MSTVGYTSTKKTIFMKTLKIFLIVAIVFLAILSPLYTSAFDLKVGVAGGTDTQFQYNDGLQLKGIPELTYNNVTGVSTSTTGFIFNSSLPVILDFNPTYTITQTAIDITPSGNPATTGLTLHGINIDHSGVSQANDPYLHGIHVHHPAAYTGENERGCFRAEGNGRSVSLVGRYGYAIRTQGEIHNDYTISDTELSSFVVNDITIDATDQDATSKTHAIDIALTDGLGGGSVAALATHPEVDVIHQHIGTFDPPGATYAGRYVAVGTTYTDNIDDQDVFVAVNDEIWIGHTAAFDEIQIDLSILATKDIRADFFYYHSVDGWTEFFPNDGTRGMTQDGEILWTPDLLTNWDAAGNPFAAIPGDDGGAGYWIAIRRTRVSDPGTVHLTTAKILVATTYQWDKNGNIIANTITATVKAYPPAIPIEWALDGTTPPDASEVVTNSRKIPVRQFQGVTANQDLLVPWGAPGDLSATTISFRVRGYVTNATAPADGETVIFTLDAASVGDSENLNKALTASPVSVTFTADATYVQYDRWATAWGDLTVADLAAYEDVMFQLIRDQGTDTYEQKIGVAWMDIIYTKQISNN